MNEHYSGGGKDIKSKIKIWGKFILIDKSKRMQRPENSCPRPTGYTVDKLCKKII